MRLFASASRKAMIVCPHRPKITSTPRRSRYSVSRYAAIRFSVAFSIRSALRGATVLIRSSRWWLERFAVVKLAEQLLLGRAIFRCRTAHPRDVHVVLQRDVFVRDVP